MRRQVALRAVVVLLLVFGAFWAALPWLGCVTEGPDPLRHMFPLFGICTWGGGFPADFFSVPFKRGVAGFNGPYYGNLLVGILYLAAAAFVARTRRSF